MSENWLDFSRYAVFGAGRSGKAAANLLARRGKQVLVSDIRSDEQMREDARQLHDRVEYTGGGNVIGDAEVIVTSPGLKPGLEVFERARRRGVPVVSEVDLAFDASCAKWIGITGTDGKTTTTGLVGAMLEAAGREHVVAGNIGTALCDVVESLGDESVVVAEISANQLWSCHHLTVDTAAITNIAEDHLDYFEDFADYPPAKHRLVKLQDPGDSTVLPADDDRMRAALAEHCRRGLTWFGAGESVPADQGDAVFFDDESTGRWRLGDRQGVWFDDFAESNMIGAHNQLNAACAAAVARSVGAEWDAIAAGLRAFEPPAHRMQLVDRIEGVTYINDSKATNAHASLAGIEGLDPPLIVIAGGRDKGLDLGEWARRVAALARQVVVIGEITDRMTGLLREQGAETTTASTLEDAVEQAHQHARPGSTVVLSPACSSYDMFSNYKQRGRVFQRAVEALGASSS